MYVVQRITPGVRVEDGDSRSEQGKREGNVYK
jgi:hypothetical protein